MAYQCPNRRAFVVRCREMEEVIDGELEEHSKTTKVETHPYVLMGHVLPITRVNMRILNFFFSFS